MMIAKCLLNQALSEADKALKEEQGNSALWAERGAVLEEMGDYTSALKSLERALELDNQNDRARSLIGHATAALFDLKRYDEALDAIGLAVAAEQTGERKAWMRDGFGDRFWEVGRYEDALTQYRAAVELQRYRRLFHCNHLSQEGARV